MKLERFDPYLIRMPPGYFALVMATGIISVAALRQHYDWLAHALLWVNIAAYLILWGLNLVRAYRHHPLVFRDLADHHRGPGYFNFVAATCILGVQFYAVKGWTGAAAIAWYFAAILWFFITYGFFSVATMAPEQRSLKEGLDGTWLVPVVATQGVAILATVLLGQQTGARDEFHLFVALCFFLVGCLLYLVFITLIIYRFIFFSFDFGGLTPPYWVNMGATAITALTGAELVYALEHTGYLLDLKPFIKGLSLLFWAFGTWWIPLLLVLGAWRHLIKRVRLSHHGQFWSMVFPLGMYTVSTGRLAQMLDADFLAAIPPVMIWVALLAWVLTVGGAGISFLRMLRESALNAREAEVRGGLNY